MSTEIKLPRMDYMCQGNTYSGSVGNFRYKIFADGSDEKVFVAAAYYDNCFEVEDANGRTTKKEFEYSDEGITAAQQWLISQQGE